MLLREGNSRGAQQLQVAVPTLVAGGNRLLGQHGRIILRVLRVRRVVGIIVLVSWRVGTLNLKGWVIRRGRGHRSSPERLAIGRVRRVWNGEGRR